MTGQLIPQDTAIFQSAERVGSAHNIFLGIKGVYGSKGPFCCIALYTTGGMFWSSFTSVPRESTSFGPQNLFVFGFVCGSLADPSVECSRSPIIASVVGYQEYLPPEFSIVC